MIFFQITKFPFFMIYIEAPPTRKWTVMLDQWHQQYYTELRGLFILKRWPNLEFFYMKNYSNMNSNENNTQPYNKSFACIRERMEQMVC